MMARGRGLKEPTCTARYTRDGVTLRVDDERIPEYWVEIDLSIDELRELLAEALAERHAAAQRSA